MRNAFVVGLCVCLAIPATALARALVPGAYATLLPFVCHFLLLSICCSISPRLNKLGLLSKDWFLLNGSRWVVIIVALKLLSYMGQDAAQVANRMLDDLPLMRRDVLVYLFTPQFFASLGVVLVVWLACRTLGQDLASLTWGERELAHDPELGLRTDRTQIRQMLVAHIVGFGVLGTLLGGAAQWAGRQTGSGLWVAIDLLAYFVLGLALIGHSQLTILRTSWLWERTPIAKNLVVRWSVYGAVFLIGLALLALVLPVGNVSGLLPLLNYAFGVLFYIVQLIAFLVVALLQLLMLPAAEDHAPHVFVNEQVLGRAARARGNNSGALAAEVGELGRRVDLAAARQGTHKTKRQIEEIISGLAPQPDAPTVVRRLPGTSQLRPDAVAITTGQLRPDAVGTPGSKPHPH
ncbi:MAG: hypothetical protein HC853_19310, partial [Anaerolineae bacterium]|nr:hypothetical protein [Anaerolineae bacterium]